MSEPIKLILTTTFGLEKIVKLEAQAIGLYTTTISDGKVECNATLADIPKANINLRCADRVLIKLAEFKATDFDQLFDAVKAIDWQSYIPIDAKITVSGKSVKSKLESVRSNQSITKKAILKKLEEQTQVDEFPESGNEYTIQVSILKDIVQITLDTSGNGLHKRGYREKSGEVPLRETLAAALIKLSSWKPHQVLVDPMCGSGTICIEAAKIARNIAPGLSREFAAEHWTTITEESWTKAREEAVKQILPSGHCKIVGYDISSQRIGDSLLNARNAGVSEDIAFIAQDVEKLELKAEKGVIISNPPYGIKLGNDEQIENIYKALSNALKDKEKWDTFIFTADQSFPEKFIRPRPTKKRKLYSAKIETHYYQYF